MDGAPAPPRTAIRRVLLALGLTVAACGGNEPPANFPSLAGARCYRLAYADTAAAAGLPKGIALQGTGDSARAVWLPGKEPVWMIGLIGSLRTAGTDSLTVLFNSPRNYSRLELRRTGDRLHGQAQGGGHGPLATIGWTPVEGERFACDRVRHLVPPHPASGLSPRP